MLPAIRDFLRKRMLSPRVPAAAQGGVELHSADLRNENFLRHAVGTYTANVYPAGATASHTGAVVAAAGRYGVEHKQFDDTIIFAKAGRVIGALHGMQPSLTSMAASRICSDKVLSQWVLDKSQIPTPAGASFAPDDFEGAVAFSRSLGCPAVVKPNNLRGGRGVSVNITEPEAFRFAWDLACRAQQEAGTGRHGRASILVQRFALGIDVRAIVVAGKFVCATSRIPANVVGDGRSRIATLIVRKNKARQKNPYLARLPIKPDEALKQYIAARGLTLDSVPPKGEIVFLRGQSNLTSGGDNIDTTDLLSPGIKRLAEAAAKAVPGLGFAGVDLLLPSLHDASRATILEMNTNANLTMHYCPMFGAKRDPGIAIIKAFLKSI